MKIWYGICGEGRGHLARSSSILEYLDDEVEIFSFGNAETFLKRQFHNIYGLRFGYRGNRVSNVKTLRKLVDYYRYSREANKNIFRHNLDKYGPPDLIISDFEPTICQFGRENGIPVVTIDSQHRFSETNWELPTPLAVYNKAAQYFISAFIGEADRHLAVSFCNMEYLREDIVHNNVIVRKSLTRGKPERQGFLLVYLHDSILDRALKVLRKVGYPLVIYNGVTSGKEKHIIWKGFDYNSFSEDLLNCAGVICGAGIELVGEANFLNKKIMTIPMPGQYEQYINGYYAQQSGIAQNVHVKDFTKEALTEFVWHERRDKPNVMNGIVDVLKVIKSYENKG